MNCHVFAVFIGETGSVKKAAQAVLGKKSIVQD